MPSAQDREKAEETCCWCERQGEKWTEVVTHTDAGGTRRECVRYDQTGRKSVSFVRVHDARGKPIDDYWQFH